MQKCFLSNTLSHKTLFAYLKTKTRLIGAFFLRLKVQVNYFGTMIPNNIVIVYVYILCDSMTRMALIFCPFGINGHLALYTVPYVLCDLSNSFLTTFSLISLGCFLSCLNVASSGWFAAQERPATTLHAD